MGFSLGIVGLPNVGKSTLFNALSKAGAEVSNYPFCTINPNVGVVEVPDPRLEKIREIMGSARAVPTIIEFVDIAGLVKNAHQGEGLGNQFLSRLREVDAVVHCVRCFADEKIAHLTGEVNPKRDIEIINLELILADLQTLEKRISSVKTAAKSGEKKYLKELEGLDRIKSALDSGKPARSVGLALSDLHLLTLKPRLYAANMDEEQILSPEHPCLKQVEEVAKLEGTEAVAVSAKLEAELAELSEQEASAYLKEAGIKGSGLERLIKAGYRVLDLITFFTANENEARAWTVKRGTGAQVAAGKIHSDMEKGFISAEAISSEKLLETGSYPKAKEKGLVRAEGRDYVVQDGELLYFRFSRS